MCLALECKIGLLERLIAALLSQKIGILFSWVS